MYVPPHFHETRPDLLHGLIRACPLGTMVVVTAQGLEANHIPFSLLLTDMGNAKLIGHVARANSVWEEASELQEALVIFEGPAAYIRPGWYPTKLEHGKVVPTWNYVAVHAYGAIRFHHERPWIMAQIDSLTKQMETGLSHPWSISDAPTDYIEKLIENIIGVEIDIHRLVGKWKISQNQPATSRLGITQGLDSLGEPRAADLAKTMRES